MRVRERAAIHPHYKARLPRLCPDIPYIADASRAHYQGPGPTTRPNTSQLGHRQPCRDQALKPQQTWAPRLLTIKAANLGSTNSVYQNAHYQQHGCFQGIILTSFDVYAGAPPMLTCLIPTLRLSAASTGTRRRPRQ